MSFQSKNISLIDLSQQFSFAIDDDIKRQICFSETLVISCVHGEGDFVSESTSSEWTCTEPTESELKTDKEAIDKRKASNVTQEFQLHDEVVEEEDQFHFYFFPDCKKEIKQDSKSSLLIQDGMPVLRQKKGKPTICTCNVDEKGECPCHLKFPCECGAKTLPECTCSQLKKICICDESKPDTKCRCKRKKICMCYPDGVPRPSCVCDTIDKPCICQHDKFPYPVCLCKHKPKEDGDENHIVEEYGEETISKTTTSYESIEEPCLCQDVKKPTCLCVRGKECTCKENECLCGVQPTCVCDPSIDEEQLCTDKESKTICECPKNPICTCDAESIVCKCFPKPDICTCGNPENCRCFVPCECTDPCICDTAPATDICTCIENRIDAGTGLCVCPSGDEQIKILKKTRAGKDGFRWCNAVDPKHTFFDYAYNRHDKISYKEQEKEKLKILGLYDESDQQVESEVEKIKAPPFKKNVGQPTLDCCSAVGGITISVDTLGEEKEKFLIQVVSHSSKNGAKCGTKLISIVDCNMHTLEENRIEYITKKGITKERRSYMAICDNGYYNKVTRICGERHFVKRIYHTYEVAHNFLLEGANVVLLRYLGISRYRGHIKTGAVLIDGVICESIYVCLGVSQAVVNGSPLFIVKVERHIIEPTGFMHQTLTALTLRGYVVSHEWADHTYIFHVNPLLRVTPEKDEIEAHEPLRENWRSDLQLLSDYLDFKSTRASEGARYVSENGELTGVIRDYLQTLLLLRPHDALNFTHHYFGTALSDLDLPHNEFFEPSKKNVRYYYFEE